MSCCDDICLVRAEAAFDGALRLLLTLAESSAVSVLCPVHAKDNDHPFLLLIVLPWYLLYGAAVDELLALD